MFWSVYLGSIQKVQRFTEKEIRDNFLTDSPPPAKWNRANIENSMLLENDGSTLMIVAFNMNTVLVFLEKMRKVQLNTWKKLTCMTIQKCVNNACPWQKVGHGALTPPPFHPTLRRISFSENCWTYERSLTNHCVS